MKITKAFFIFITLILVLVLGYAIGRTNTIRQAELLDITDTEYYIGFGDEIHTYTFD